MEKAMTAIKLPQVGQHVRLAANEDEGWPEEVGEWLGDGVIRLLPEHRVDGDDDGLRDGIDLEDPSSGEVWSIVEDDVVTGTRDEVRATVAEVEDARVVTLEMSWDVSLNLREMLRRAAASGNEYALEVIGALDDVLR